MYLLEILYTVSTRNVQIFISTNYTILIFHIMNLLIKIENF